MNPDSREPSPIIPSRIEDKATKPRGVIPKHMQSMVIIGVAVLMILIMWLTGGGKRAASLPKQGTSPFPTVTPTDTAKVQDFKQSIQSQQRAVRQAIPAIGPSQVGQANVPGAYSGYGSASQASNSGQPGVGQMPSLPAYSSYPAQSQEGAPLSVKDSVRAEQKKREYLSLFAPNVALTYRKGEEAQKLTGAGGNLSSAVTSESSPPIQDPQADALRQAQALAAMSPLAGMPLPQFPTGTNPTQLLKTETEKPKSEARPANPDVSQPGVFNAAGGKKYLLFEGTVMETVLINRLDGSFSGPVNCLVTNDVYSHDREHVLVPAGTKVLGEAEKVNALGQGRLAVFFHRLIMPDGYSVSLDQFKGLDQVGETALRDKVNNHYMKIFGASLAVGVLGGIAQVGTGNIFTESAMDRARVGFGQSMALTGERILDRFLNVLPTVTIREGTRVKVYLSNDLLLPDYKEHTMPSNL